MQVNIKNLIDDVQCYVIAGHKGQPKVVKSKGRKGRRRCLKGKGGCGALEKERPPVFEMIQRDGQVVIKKLAYVKHKNYQALDQRHHNPRDTDLYRRYNIDARLNK